MRVLDQLSFSLGSLREHRLRAALSNHRTREEDLRILIEETRKIGGLLAGA